MTEYIVLGAKTGTVYHRGPSRADCMKWITEQTKRKHGNPMNYKHNQILDLGIPEPMYVCQSNKPKPKFEPAKTQHVVDDDEIVKLHNDGLKPRDISMKLGLSEVTVEEHLKKIFDSTGGRNTLDQVAIAALYKAGFKPKPIAEKLGYNRRSVENVIFKLKKAGKL